ncbi:2-amino-4-hydroxy-6-hydroxymethyldihydropteridine diphosphokinase [Campylobacter sp. RM13119]|uniref:2-amino-4-hydroxy-6- hydroxymethyldihydropteridine diphosphokinase n=1 Tax=Campylobacter californiensis TaxID=1032243 RepID=UPI0014746821|nr:2-amino-4-hydroxy-6-hydroxymethyldihydropteridine diphosphokinase [Campylobacter sp. RM13119]MBE3606210.1 2-amino-4-hydroxy-6-hydroxymethyldihydropteridine diphosphokinase [Campylobacter sp. RM13119]
MKILGARGLVRSRFCPCYFGFKDGFRYVAVVGLGGNIGRSDKRFDKFIRVLLDDRRFHVVEVSPILVNAAFGYEDQADFSNAVINLQTSVSAYALLKILQRYELKFKRTRSFKNAPRTLDLDILYFGAKVLRSSKLTIPHPGVTTRMSVIVPMGLMRS